MSTKSLNDNLHRSREPRHRGWLIALAATAALFATAIAGAAEGPRPRRQRHPRPPAPYAARDAEAAMPRISPDAAPGTAAALPPFRFCPYCGQPLDRAAGPAMRTRRPGPAVRPAGRSARIRAPFGVPIPPARKYSGCAVER
ncbi:MAG: hypothetical protein JXP34_19390 [Planctomycetes bacterium]|nr:hypothetical protein [Planctomycetota bacterium]